MLLPAPLRLDCRTVTLPFAGVAVFVSSAGVVDVIIRGVFGDGVGERRRRMSIDEIHDHVTACGYGRAGRSLAAQRERSLA